MTAFFPYLFVWDAQYKWSVDRLLSSQFVLSPKYFVCRSSVGLLKLWYLECADQWAQIFKPKFKMSKKVNCHLQEEITDNASQIEWCWSALSIMDHDMFEIFSCCAFWSSVSTSLQAKDNWSSGHSKMQPWAYGMVSPMDAWIP